MKWIKRIAIGLLSLVLIVVLADIGLNAWIKYQLPHIINENNDSPYEITYKELKISLLDRNLKATDIVLVPKASLNHSKNKAGIYSKITAIEVNDFSLWDIVFGKRIHARNLIVSNPEVNLLKANEKALENPKSIGSEIVKPFSRIITVSDVFLNNGKFRIGTLKNKTILEISNVSIKLEGILITDATLAQKLPFAFRTYAIDCDSVFYRPDGFYRMTLQGLKTTNTGLRFDKFELRPELNRKAFVRALPKEKDIYDISVGSVAVDRIDWGFKGDDFFFRSGNITLDRVVADIYRNKGPKDDPTTRKMYSEMLRNIPFALKVDTLLMRRSRITYEEALDYDKSPGVLTFSKFNMHVTGLQSGFRQAKMPDVRIKVLCNFMESSRLDVDWTFNVLDKSDRFNIRGRFFDFPADRLTAFTKPYLNVTFKGSLDEVYFNFTGNNERSGGDFAINYDDLKVKIFKKKDKKKQSKLLSAIANLFVKHDTKDKVNNAEVSVKRTKNRSFFNLLWRCLEEGLKKIML